MQNGSAGPQSNRHEREFSRYRTRLHSSLEQWLNWKWIEANRPTESYKRSETDYVSKVDEDLAGYYRALRLGHPAAYKAFNSHILCRDTSEDLERKIAAYCAVADEASSSLEFLLLFDWSEHDADVVLRKLRKVAFSDNGRSKINPSDLNRVVSWLRNLIGLAHGDDVPDNCWCATGNGFTLTSFGIFWLLTRWYEAADSLCGAFDDTHYSTGDLGFLKVSANGWRLEETIDKIGSEAAIRFIENAMNWVDDYLGMEPLEPLTSTGASGFVSREGISGKMIVEQEDEGKGELPFLGIRISGDTVGRNGFPDSVTLLRNSVPRRLFDELFCAQGNGATRNELLEAVWGDQPASPNAVDQQAARLRVLLAPIQIAARAEQKRFRLVQEVQ